MGLKDKLKDMEAKNEDLLKKISDVKSKTNKFLKLRIEVEDSTWAMTERKEAIDKKLEEKNKALAKKTGKLAAITWATHEKLLNT